MRIPSLALSATSDRSRGRPRIFVGSYAPTGLPKSGESMPDWRVFHRIV